MQEAISVRDELENRLSTIRDVYHVRRIKVLNDMGDEERRRDERIAKITEEEERKKNFYGNAKGGYDKAMNLTQSREHLEKVGFEMSMMFQTDFSRLEQEKERVGKDFKDWRTKQEQEIQQKEAELEETKIRYDEASNAAELQSQKSEMIERVLKFSERMELEYDTAAEVEKDVILNEIEKEMLYHAGLDKFEKTRRRQEEEERERERSLTDQYNAMILRKFGTSSRAKLNELKSQFEFLHDGLFKTQCSYDDGDVKEREEETAVMFALSKSGGAGEDEDALSMRELRTEDLVADLLLTGRVGEEVSHEAAEGLQGKERIEDMRRSWLISMRQPLLSVLADLSATVGEGGGAQLGPMPGEGSRDSKERMRSSCLQQLQLACDAAAESRKLIDALLAAGNQLAAHASETLGGGGGDLTAFLDALAEEKRARDLFAVAGSIGAWRLSESRAGEAACKEMEEKAEGEMERKFGKGVTTMSRGNAAVLNSEMASKFFSEQHQRFSSSSELSVQVRTDLYGMLRQGRSDEEIIHDRKLQAAGIVLTRATVAAVREDWNAENEMRRAILGHRTEAAADEDKGEEESRVGQGFVGGNRQTWTLVAGRWHSVLSRPQRGLWWRPSDFLQVAHVDFEVIRRSSLHQVVARVAPSDRTPADSHVPSHRRPSNHGRPSLVPGEEPVLRGPAQPPSPPSLQQVSPWIGTSKKNKNADAPAVAYDASEDYQKQVKLLPHGDHLNVSSKPRLRWNSSSFSDGTAGPMVRRTRRMLEGLTVACRC